VSRAVVIGVGNAYRRDDGAGLAIVGALQGRLPPGVELVGCEQEPSRLMDAWEGAETVIVVDAAASGAAAGTVHRFDAAAGAVPAGIFRSSTHAFGVGDAVEIARALGSLPPRVVVYGIEGGDFDAGVGLTASVEAAISRVADAVLRDLEEVPCTSER
jgi:hydrogenase maturation protease